VSLVRPTPRDLGVASGPPPSRGQALANRRLAPCPRPPNPLGRLILRQFPQTAPDRARRHAGRHRHRGNAAISHGKRLRRGNQATTPFIKKRRHRQKPLSNGLDIDHNHHIWYKKVVVNSIFTLSEVDSIISGQALSLRGVGWAAARGSRPTAPAIAGGGNPAVARADHLFDLYVIHRWFLPSRETRPPTSWSRAWSSSPQQGRKPARLTRPARNSFR